MAVFPLLFNDNPREPLRIQVGGREAVIDLPRGSVFRAEAEIAAGHVSDQLKMIMEHPNIGVYVNDMMIMTGKLHVVDGYADINMGKKIIDVGYQVVQVLD
jgi:hypothetical protein